ncbi:hypothetical protein DSO57_1024492 [Entomophthora muscae]|uniref:Uncharacterized protein n=1 Tax=Entomophthora muscae TaxID=34485 RepID=A0ACC2SFB6_9FUNG|nr:hypothetical protein DSO57_1024492 [Entomophthora muscae]
MKMSQVAKEREKARRAKVLALLFWLSVNSKRPCVLLKKRQLVFSKRKNARLRRKSVGLLKKKDLKKRRVWLKSKGSRKSVNNFARKGSCSPRPKKRPNVRLSFDSML